MPHPKQTTKPETSNSDSQKADDNELDEDDDEQPMRTNLLHQFSIQTIEDSAADLGHDEDEQATKVDQRRRRFLVHHLQDLFEKKLGAKHFDYGRTMAAIVK